MKYKVEDRPGLVRDHRSKAIISEDREALQRYLTERNYRQRLTSTNQGLEDQINNLKTEMQELKSLVQKLISRDT
jgi:ribonuclease HII